jgi:hypothetical protein
MEMTGEQRVSAPQQDTWNALNDPETLKACIPGCESIEPVSNTEYRVLMTARVGPVSAKFKGTLTLSDIDAPNSYSLAFEGQGGVAGFGKGSAQVRLAPEGEDTRLAYAVKASIGGKLAQIGSRLVDAAAKKIADDFFRAFNERLSARHGAAAAAHEEEHHPEPVARDPDLPRMGDASLSWFAAAALVVFAVALVVWLG